MAFTAATTAASATAAPATPTPATPTPAAAALTFPPFALTPLLLQALISPRQRQFYLTTALCITVSQCVRQGDNVGFITIAFITIAFITIAVLLGSASCLVAFPSFHRIPPAHRTAPSPHEERR
jgi:hypothetical protein